MQDRVYRMFAPSGWTYRPLGAGWRRIRASDELENRWERVGGPPCPLAAPFRFWLGEHTHPSFWASGLPGGGGCSILRDMGKAPVLRPGVAEPGD